MKELCIECYEKEYGKHDNDNTLEITRDKKACENCGKEKNIVKEKMKDYIVTHENFPNFFK